MIAHIISVNLELTDFETLFALKYLIKFLFSKMQNFITDILRKWSPLGSSKFYSTLTNQVYAETTNLSLSASHNSATYVGLLSLEPNTHLKGPLARMVSRLVACWSLRSFRACADRVISWAINFAYSRGFAQVLR